MITRTYVHVWRTSRKDTTFLLVWQGSFIEASLLGNMKEDEQCDYDHTLIDDSSAQGGDKENCHVGEDNLKMCKDVVIEMELMHSQAKNDLHEDVRLESEFLHALDVTIDEHEHVEMSSQSYVNFIVAHVDVGDSRRFKSALVSQLNGNRTLSEIN